MAIEVKGRNEMGTIDQAYEEFMISLFGSVPEDPSQHEVKRSEYTEKMKAVQSKYGLKEGNKDFLPWIFTLVGKSPQIIEDTEGTED